MSIKTIVATGMLFLAGTIVSGQTSTNQVKEKNMEKLELVKEWDKVFPQSNKVVHEKVTFRNRYGITLVADMYIPKNVEGKLAAIAVSGPFGGVKEQSSGLYAQTLAERGFLTIAFDPSYTGESGGQPGTWPRRTLTRKTSVLPLIFFRLAMMLILNVLEF